MKILKTSLIWLIFFIISAKFLSYRILQVPTGLTVDESAFGYNATLLSRTGHDENGRFLPFFVLSIDGKDWRQPITQYYLALFFRLFGPSIYNLRFSSVVIILVSAVMLFYLAKQLVNRTYALLTMFIFLLTPIIMLHSHLGLDNIMPIPFTILWLFGLHQFNRHRQTKFLILAGIALGISFYTYKGMRAVVPIWCIQTIIYLFLTHQCSFKKSFKSITIFSLSILPFFAIIPFLEKKYPGAVFDQLRPQIESIYQIFYAYFSNFDPTFLFIKGDALLYHSTQKHGMVLLATAPFFFIGVYQAIKKRNFHTFILISFFSAPLLYGLVNSIHRASRIMTVIPAYCLITTLGLYTLYQKKQKMLILIPFILLCLINYLDFIKYYWYTYPKFTENIFGHFQHHDSYKILAQEAQKRNLTPYISQEVNQKFFEAIYFPTPPQKINLDIQTPPSNSILLTIRKDIPGLTRLDTALKEGHLQIIHPL